MSLLDITEPCSVKSLDSTNAEAIENLTKFVNRALQNGSTSIQNAQEAINNLVSRVKAIETHIGQLEGNIKSVQAKLPQLDETIIDLDVVATDLDDLSKIITSMEGSEYRWEDNRDSMIKILTEQLEDKDRQLDTLFRMVSDLLKSKED